MPRQRSKTNNKATRTPLKKKPEDRPARPSRPVPPRDATRVRPARPLAAAKPVPTPVPTKTTRTADPVYIGHVVPGLERLATRELTSAFEGVEVLETLKQFDERTSLILFSWRGDASLLLDLTLFEDIFAMVADRIGITGDRVALKAVQSVVGGPGLEQAVRIANPILPGNRKKPSFRVIARKAGDHVFRRTDLRTAVEQGVQLRQPDWTLTEGARYEIWAQLVENRLIVGLRLSDETMRQRTYKTVNLPASLKPTVARAMITLTRPEDDDVFLDPMCGAGTLLIERAHAGRYARLEGGDSDHVAVHATLENFGTKYRPFEIREWDARSLPFEEGEISAIASNLPFGKQIGSRADNQVLYPKLLDEWTRVLRPGGRLVLLTGEGRLMRTTLKSRPNLVWEQTLPVVIRGFPAEIFVLTWAGF